MKFILGRDSESRFGHILNFKFLALRVLLADEGWGTLFCASAGFFCMKTNVTRKRKVEKSIPRCEMERLSEGYKRVIDKIGGPMPKNVIFVQPLNQN